MRNRTLLALASAAALCAPLAARADASPRASWSLTLTVWDGLSRYDVLGLRHGIGTVGSQDKQDLLDGNFNAMGAQAVMRIKWFELGLLYEGTLVDSGASSEIVTPLVGFKWDVAESLRLDFLGELGGHKITNIGSGNAIATETRTVWLPSLGFRPSLSYRIAVGPTRVVLALTPFARWDLVKKDVNVSTSVQDEYIPYRAGGTTFGIVGGVGLEI